MCFYLHEFQLHELVHRRNSRANGDPTVCKASSTEGVKASGNEEIPTFKSVRKGFLRVKPQGLHRTVRSLTTGKSDELSRH